MQIKIYSKSNTLVFAGNAEVKGKFRGMGEETFTASFVSTESLALDYGCYMDIDGARYAIHINPKKEDVGTHNVYSVVFESQKYELAGAQMQSFGRAKYDITTDLEGWVKLWMENANRVGSGWSYIINEPVKTLKTLLVDGETCLSAVNRIFSEFGKEFKFVGKQLVVGRIGVDLSTVLKVGRYNGLYSVTEDQKGTSNPITRMYVSGSDKNLPVDYCNANGATPTDRLNIKAVNGGLPYLENAADIAKYGIIEGNYSNEDIFPHRTGVVSSVDGADYQNLFDTSLDFDMNAQRLPGVPANITFITGDLSNYTFDVISYDAATKKIRIAVGNDGSGKELPNAVLKPKTGDKYVLTSIAMPQSYITTAENDLKADAQVEFEKRRGFQGIFSANSIDPIFQQDQNFYPSIGDRIGIESNGVVKQVRIVEYSINKTSGVTIYEGIQFADTIEPTNLQKDANSQQKTNTDIYIANKGAKDANTAVVNAASIYVKYQTEDVKPPQTIYGDIRVIGKIYSSDDIIAFSNGGEGGGTAPTVPIATYSTTGVVKIDPNTLTVDAGGMIAVKGDMFNLTNYFSKSESDSRFAALGHYHTKSQITDFAHSHIASEIPELDWSKITTGKPNFIVEGDARLINARAAADVYAWAKATTKSTYSASEVGAMPENGAYRPSLLFNTATVDKGIYNGNWHTGNYWGIGNGPTGAQVKIGSTDINGNYVAGDLQLLLGSSNKIVATVDQIPSTLPANGGNADTVDGFHKSDFWHRDNLNRSDTDFAAKNINIIGNVKSSQRNAPPFVGNWGAYGYWCLGEDSANGIDWVKLVGSDGSLFNSTPVNLNITGNLKVNGGDIKSKTQTLMDASGNIRWTVQVNAANFALEFMNASGVKVAAITQNGDGHFKNNTIGYSPFNY